MSDVCIVGIEVTRCLGGEKRKGESGQAAKELTKSAQVAQGAIIDPALTR